MTRDDIIRMAQEAGFAHSWSEAAGEALERFAALVAAHEREACAQVCEETTAAWAQPIYVSAYMDCADAIRARSEK